MSYHTSLKGCFVHLYQVAVLFSESFAKNYFKLHFLLIAGPFKNVNIPEKFRLPMMNKVPNEVALFTKVPRGTRESYRIIGEERLHNKLLLGNHYKAELKLLLAKVSKNVFQVSLE